MEAGDARPGRFIDRLAELGYKAPITSREGKRLRRPRGRAVAISVALSGVAAFATMNVMMLSIPVSVRTHVQRHCCRAARFLPLAVRADALPAAAL